MIDRKIEELFSFSQLAESLPKRRNGQATSQSCIYRWSNEGIRGIRLEYMSIGAMRCSSQQALDRFFDEIKKQVESKRKIVPIRENKYPRTSSGDKKT